MTDRIEFDAVVVGTGFGGAVTACRLVQAGYDVCILERGRRYGPEDFPRYPTDELFAEAGSVRQQFTPPPDFSRWLWGRDQGLYEVRDLGGAVAVQSAGYGGGSLIYANVHLRPPDNVFETDWPEPYRASTLRPYFDLAAFMLRASPIPQRLAKTVQLQRAAEAAAAPHSWFRTPLAVNFETSGSNAFGRDQLPCDMRGRCWRGCDRQAKNTLDLNYLACAEDGGADIRTLAEVTEIHRDGGDFIVYYTDWLTGERRDGQSEITPPTKGPFVRAKHVFLCAGAVNTTHLLFKSKDALWENGGVPRALGSRYFPNSDSLGVVFDCEEPHEADYGPTITAAMLYDQRADDDFSCMLDFREGRLDVGGRPPRAGDTVKAPSGWTATLAHDPIFDWGGWAPPTDDGPEPGVGVLALPPTDITDDALNPGDTLTFSSRATAKVAARLVKRRHWLLVEDGGYPSDIEPLTAVFRSSVWLRRNRYLEDLPRPHASTAEMPGYPVSQRVTTPLRRPPAGRLRVEAFEEALGGTSRRVFAGEGTVPRSFAPLRFGGESPSRRQFLLPDLFGEQLGTMLPGWFVQALAKDRDDLLQQAAAFALPVLGRLFDELSRSAAQQIDPETRARLSKNVVDDRQLEILARGLLRQVVQILAGSEATVASKAAHVLLDPLPETPQQLVKLVGDALLWAIGYDTTRGHTGMLLTMGRDNFRGKLELAGKELKATLPTRVLDTVSTTHERVLREVAATWRGELRTNPGWTTLGQRITVHSQGGCPMGPDVGFAVTTPDGEVQGCSGLYVMDAAAFPASVGVNPSATIVAIAEYKVEQFIRKDKPENVHWRAPDYDEATRWVDRCGRAALDPLNSGDIQSRNAPPDSIGVLGLTFTETMRGFAAPVSGTDDLAALSKVSDAKDEGVARFLSAETRGIETEPTWLLTLNVEAHDLARLISRVDTVAPMPLRVDGELSLSPPGSTPGTQDESRTYKVAGGSHLRIFVKRKPLSAESSDTTPPTKYFHYHLECLGAGDSFVIDGVKVLHNAPGFDAWHDTSTLYFDSTGPGGRHHLGVLRVSIETFLRSQLPSMNVTGTHDLARKSWALLAFFQYFAWELSEIYLERFDDWKQAFIKLLTAIHV